MRSTRTFSGLENCGCEIRLISESSFLWNRGIEGRLVEVQLCTLCIMHLAYELLQSQTNVIDS